jgi:hypothetical protein
VQWLRLKAKTTSKLALQDAWQEGGPRVLTGLSVNAIAVVVASIATKKPAALWTIIAYPIFMISAWCFFFIRRMRGWNRLWKRETRISRAPEGPQINVSLLTAEPAHLLSGAGHELTCYVQEPGGRLAEATSVMGFYRARVFISYPQQFPGAIPMVAGDYVVIWKEQDPPQTGKWRVIDLSRVTISEADFESPVAPPGAVAPD